MKKLYLGSMAAMVVLCLALSQPAEAGPRNKSGKEKKLLDNPASAAATAEVAPQSQTVEPLVIPFDPNLPTFMVTVEPMFIVSAQGIVSGGGVTPGAPQQSTYTSPWFNGSITHNPQSVSPSVAPNQMLGYGASAQLMTALMNIGNVSLIDYETYMADPNKFPNVFLIKGTVTEFSETNQLDESKKGGSTGPAGVLVNTAGNIFDLPGLSIAGQVLNIANAGKKTVTTTRTGMVGISLRIVKSDGQIVGAPICKGTFVTQSATQIKHGLGLESSKAEYLASTLDQAGQAALNDANTQIWAVLKRQATNQVAALPAEAPLP